MCYISQQYDKNREEEYENCILPVGLVKYREFAKLDVFQGQSRNEASHVSHISVDDSSITGAPMYLEGKAIENMVFKIK